MRHIQLTFLVFAFAITTWAQNIPEKPNPARFVNDFANVLSDQEEASLEQKLRNYQDTTSNQFAVVTIESLEGYDVESYTYKLASTWGIGQKDKNNGILILLAKQEHKIRIEVGYGLEGVIPDLVAKRVIREVMTPAFKQGSFYAGLDEGTSHLIKYASGEFKAEPQKKEKGSGKALIFIVIIIIFIIYSFMSKVNRVRGSHIGNSLSFWTILSLLGSGNDRNRGGGGGWGGGSGGGGGGFDFGGGGFGGGGSSGDW